MGCWGRKKDVCEYVYADSLLFFQHRAIVARRNNPGAEESDRLFAIRPFDIHWMEASAWGLAVHRSARLIAISANTHEVRVLVYGLARPEEEGDLFPRKTNGFIRLKVSAGSIRGRRGS